MQLIFHNLTLNQSPSLSPPPDRFPASPSIFLSHSTLNNNNLTALPHNAFGGLGKLRALRLSDNPFACDCHLSWLSRYLRSAPRLAPYTRCQSPSQLKGQNVADLHDQEFKCSGMVPHDSFHTDRTLRAAQPPQKWTNVVGPRKPYAKLISFICQSSERTGGLTQNKAL